VSDPLAAGDIGGHEREGAEAKAEKKNVDHCEPFRRGLPAIGPSMKRRA
jgi:hypothetical protein